MPNESAIPFARGIVVEAIQSEAKRRLASRASSRATTNLKGSPHGPLTGVGTSPWRKSDTSRH
jgi:hypothetical protein